MNAPVLSARDVTVRFGGITALSEVRIDVAPRGVTGLIGPNGAGKSTLFGVLSGLLRPASGTVELKGEDITRLPSHRRSRQGMSRTFQHPELFGTLSVRDHLALAYRVRHEPRRMWSDFRPGGNRTRSAAETDTVEGLLADLGLTRIADQAASGLPLGLARIVEVARSLAGRPDVVLLDEPSAGLNPTETGELADVLAAAGTQAAVLLVEHDLDLVLGLAHTLYVLDFGRLIAEGDAATVRASEAVRAAYLGGAVTGGAA